jgi:hypothetical protein
MGDADNVIFEHTISHLSLETFITNISFSLVTQAKIVNSLIFHNRSKIVYH